VARVADIYTVCICGEKQKSKLVLAIMLDVVMRVGGVRTCLPITVCRTLAEESGVCAFERHAFRSAAKSLDEVFWVLRNELAQSKVR
jgi:hypothetical protein